MLDQPIRLSVTALRSIAFSSDIPPPTARVVISLSVWRGSTSLDVAVPIEAGVGDLAGGQRRVGVCHPRRVLRFLKQVAKAHPPRQLHVVLDNYGTHKHPKVRAWLERNPRIQLHFTPTSGSWLNMVEIFFAIITRQAIRRGTFDSVKDPIAAIETFIDGWTNDANRSCGPRPPTRSWPDQAQTPSNNLKHATLGT